MTLLHWWNADWAPTPEEWTALWAFCALLVTLGAALLALQQLRSYFEERFDRARPYVLVDYYFKSGFILQLSVVNVSETPAVNVRLEVDVPFQSTQPDNAATLNRIAGEDYVISQLAPGRKMRWTLDTSKPAYFLNTGLPRVYQVTARYDDPRAIGKRRSRWRPTPPESFTEIFTLDIRQYDQAAAETDYANREWNIAKRNEARLERIAVAMESQNRRS